MANSENVPPPTREELLDMTLLAPNPVLDDIVWSEGNLSPGRYTLLPEVQWRKIATLRPTWRDRLADALVAVADWLERVADRVRYRL